METFYLYKNGEKILVDSKTCGAFISNGWSKEEKAVEVELNEEESSEDTVVKRGRPRKNPL